MEGLDPDIVADGRRSDDPLAGDARPARGAARGVAGRVVAGRDDGPGVRLLAHRDVTGRWILRLYGRKWVSTTYSLLLLRQLGLPATTRSRGSQSCRMFLDGALWNDGGQCHRRRAMRPDVCDRLRHRAAVVANVAATAGGHLHAPHPGAVWFELEPSGQPSRWNTLRALRWWSAGHLSG